MTQPLFLNPIGSLVWNTSGVAARSCSLCTVPARVPDYGEKMRDLTLSRYQITLVGRADRCTLDTALCPSLGHTSHTAPEPSLTSHLQSRTRRGNTAAHHTHPPMVLFYQVRSNMEIVVDVDCNQLWNLTIRIKHIGKDWKQMLQHFLAYPSTIMQTFC